MESKLFQKISKGIALSLVVILIFATTGISAFAKKSSKSEDDYDQYYKNKETGYEAVVDDQADLLSERAEKELMETLKEITQYGNAIYLTMEGYKSGSDTTSKVEDYYLSNFGAYESGAVYCAHCNKNRPDGYGEYEGYDYLYTEGEMFDIIGKSKCRSITDNVYDEYYEDGAKIAFEQVLVLCQGGKIAEPMKVICSIFFSLMLALLINYSIVSSKSKLKRISTAEMVSGAVHHVNILHTNNEFINQTRTYSPRSSSSGGGGGYHGGGGHGGGGHHGGGGGHGH